MKKRLLLLAFLSIVVLLSGCVSNKSEANNTGAPFPSFLNFFLGGGEEASPKCDYVMDEGNYEARTITLTFASATVQDYINRGLLNSSEDQMVSRRITEIERRADNKTVFLSRVVESNTSLNHTVVSSEKIENGKVVLYEKSGSATGPLAEAIKQPLNETLSLSLYNSRPNKIEGLRPLISGHKEPTLQQVETLLKIKNMTMKKFSLSDRKCYLFQWWAVNHTYFFCSDKAGNYPVYFMTSYPGRLMELESVYCMNLKCFEGTSELKEIVPFAPC